jgi:hypothetical protein
MIAITNPTTIPNHIRQLHESALRSCENLKIAETELLDAITAVRQQKVFRYYECSSVFEYCVKLLKLDPGVVYGFMAVAKKMQEVPELREKIHSRALNVATAKRITSVINSSNKEEWLRKAEVLSISRLEREVARANPKEEVKERAFYLNSRRIRLELGLDEKTMLKLRRIQDLESQKCRRSASLEEVMKALVDLYLVKNDPLEKAKRAIIRNGDTQRVINPSVRKDFLSGKRPAVPAAILHKVNLRDKGECQHTSSFTNEKCRQKRFLEIHHLKPVSQGGGNDIENLVTLCSEHHKGRHM